MQKTKQVNYIHFQSIDSTNNWAKNNVQTLDLECITCITASEQTSGRGRFERKWFSPKGINLYATFCFQLPKQASYLPNLAQTLSISCSKLLISLGFSPEIKWPNDLLIKYKKIAGVLCEVVSFKNNEVAILGIGLNVNMGQEYLKQLDQPATSLKIESNQEWPIDKILKKLSSQFLEDLEILEMQGFEPFKSYYENHLAFKGRNVSFQDGNQIVSGICEGVSSNGNLILLRDEGTIQLTSGSMIYP